MAAALSLGLRSAGRGWALRRVFARLLVLAVVVPALILVVLLSWSDATARRADAAERLRTTSQWMARDLDDFIGTHRAAVQELAQRRSEEATVGDRVRWQADFRRMRAGFPGFGSMLLTDERGRVLIRDPASADDAAGSVADSAYFLQARRAGAAYLSDAIPVPGSEPRVAVSAPVFYAGGRFGGVVAASMDVSAFARVRGEWLKARGFDALLLDRRGQVVYASEGVRAPLDALMETRLASQLDAVPAPNAEPADTLPLLRDVLQDAGDAYAMRMTLDSGWQLVLLLPRGELQAQQLHGLLRMLALVALTAAAVLAIAWWQMRRLTRSVDRLFVRMQRFALDHASPPIAPESMPRELAPLADALNQLADRLGQAYRDANESLEEQCRLRESLEHIIDAREREIEQRTQELRDAVTELDRISRTDALTGCLNYRGFREAATSLWQESRDNGTPLAALALDIDYFKAYNDRYGHPRGDTALKRFAGAVRSALYHREDVVVRPGGEEFIVFLPDTTLEQATHVGERIVESVRHADIVHAGSPTGVLTVSIGVACRGEDDGHDPEVMLSRADAALYRAKAAGRNRVSL